MNDTITFKECIEWLEGIIKIYNNCKMKSQKEKIRCEIIGCAFMIEELFDTYIYTDILPNGKMKLSY